MREKAHSSSEDGYLGEGAADGWSGDRTARCNLSPKSELLHWLLGPQMLFTLLKYIDIYTYIEDSRSSTIRKCTWVKDQD